MKKLEKMKAEEFFSDGLKSGIAKLNTEISKFNDELETLQKRIEKIKEDFWSFDNAAEFQKELEAVRKGTLSLAFKAGQIINKKIQLLKNTLIDKDAALQANRNAALERVKHIQGEVLKLFPGSRPSRANSVISEDEEVIELRHKYNEIETWGTSNYWNISQEENIIEDARKIISNEIELQTGKDIEND